MRHLARPTKPLGSLLAAALVALVGETAFAMAPARDGRHYLVTAWRISRPMGEWRRGDFYGHSGELADEAPFRNAVLENAEHQCERRMLGRVEVHSRDRTPWGASQGATVYAEGVTAHSTAGHGGFKLSAEQNSKVHPPAALEGRLVRGRCRMGDRGDHLPASLHGVRTALRRENDQG
jgi:hypothetical protein